MIIPGIEQRAVQHIPGLTWRNKYQEDPPESRSPSYRVAQAFLCDTPSGGLYLELVQFGPLQHREANYSLEITSAYDTCAWCTARVGLVGQSDYLHRATATLAVLCRTLQPVLRTIIAATSAPIAEGTDRFAGWLDSTFPSPFPAVRHNAHDPSAVKRLDHLFSILIIVDEREGEVASQTLFLMRDSGGQEVDQVMQVSIYESCGDTLTSALLDKFKALASDALAALPIIAAAFPTDSP